MSDLNIDVLGIGRLLRTAIRCLCVVMLALTLLAAIAVRQCATQLSRGSFDVVTDEADGLVLESLEAPAFDLVTRAGRIRIPPDLEGLRRLRVVGTLPAESWFDTEKAVVDAEFLSGARTRGIAILPAVSGTSRQFGSVVIGAGRLRLAARR